MNIFDRYEAVLGPNTHQFWIYDNETNEFIDPPADVLDQVDALDYEDAERTLLELVSEQDALPGKGWLNDGYRYDADNIEI